MALDQTGSHAGGQGELPWAGDHETVTNELYSVAALHLEDDRSANGVSASRVARHACWARRSCRVFSETLYGRPVASCEFAVDGRSADRERLG